MGTIWTPLLDRMPRGLRARPRLRAVVDLDGSPVVVRADRPAAKVVRAHVTGLLPHHRGRGRPRAQVAVRSHPTTPGAFTIHGTIEGAITSGPNLDTDLIRLLGDVVLRLDDDVLHLHAAALDLHGATMLLVGPSESGKTTLAAQLVLSGAQLRTDELVSVRPDGRVGGFRRPLMLRTPVSVDPEQVAAQLGGHVVQGADRVLVGSARAAPSEPGSCRLVVLHHRDAGRPRPEVARATRAHGVRAMIEQSFDAIRLDETAVRLLGELVVRAVVVTANYPDSAAIVPELTALLAEQAGALAGGAVHVHAPRAAAAPPAVASGQLDDAIRLFEFDDSLLLFAPATRSLLEFAGSSRDWWRRTFAEGSLPVDAPAELVDTLRLARALTGDGIHGT